MCGKILPVLHFQLMLNQKSGLSLCEQMPSNRYNNKNKINLICKEMYFGSYYHKTYCINSCPRGQELLQFIIWKLQKRRETKNKPRKQTKKTVEMTGSIFSSLWLWPIHLPLPRENQCTFHIAGMVFSGIMQKKSCKSHWRGFI